MTEQTHLSKSFDGLPADYLLDGKNCIYRHNDQSILISQHFEVIAVTKDETGSDWGRLIRFLNPEKCWVEKNITLEDLKTSGKIALKPLFREGLTIYPNKESEFIDLVIAWQPTSIITICKQLGWSNGTFLLPHHAFHEQPTRLHSSITELHLNSYAKSGCLVDWQMQIAAYAPKNPVLVTVISLAFAGPIIRLLGKKSFGLHLYGNSSTGKSITQMVAKSVWGNPNYKMSWNATMSGLEQAAMYFNDGLLVLDEIGETNPTNLSDKIYMLANQSGRLRMTEKAPTNWQLVFLSSGEINLKTALSSKGVEVKAGNLVRMLEIPSNSETFGMFDNYYGFDSPEAFANHLETQTQRFHGTAGISFIESLLKTNNETIQLKLLNYQNLFLKEIDRKKIPSQIQRSANQFSILASAGELASELGITGWAPGTAISSGVDCYARWLNQLDSIHNNIEEFQIITNIRDFIERYGARFISENSGKMIDGCLGFKKHDSKTNQTYYHFFNWAFKEACKGHNTQSVAKVLKKYKLLKCYANRFTTRVNGKDGQRHQCYSIPSNIIEFEL